MIACQSWLKRLLAIVARALSLRHMNIIANFTVLTAIISIYI